MTRECQHTCINCLYSRLSENSARLWECLLTYAIILDPDVHSCNKWVPIRPKCLDEEVEKKEKCQ